MIANFWLLISFDRQFVLFLIFWVPYDWQLISEVVVLNNWHFFVYWFFNHLEESEKRKCQVFLTAEETN